MTLLVDSHAHLDDPRFADDLRQVLERAWEAGLGRILTIVCLGEEPTRTLDQACALLERDARLYAGIGVHPHDARYWTEETEVVLEKATADPRFVAVGEIGLDFHYDFSPRSRQVEVFRCQLVWAGERRMPVIVHSREAEAETAAILREEVRVQAGRAGLPRGVVHCFSGSSEFARESLSLGFSLGFGGMLTFRRAESLRETAAEVPLESILLETDSPYLAPEPLRGRRNEPAYVRYVAAKLAEIRGLPMERVVQETTAGFERLFRTQASDGGGSRRATQ